MMLHRTRTLHGFPVLPGALPLVGHVPAIIRSLPEFFLRAEKKVGSHFWLDFGVTGKELICLLPDFAPLLQNRVTTSSVLEALDPEQLTDVMVAKDGKVHREMRAAMNGPFQFPGITAAALGPVFAGMIEARVAAWRDKRDIHLMRETRNLVLSLFFHLMGIHEHDFSGWRRNFADFTMLLVAPPIALPGSPLTRGRKARAWIDERLTGFIGSARANPDLPGLLAAAVRNSDASERPLSDRELIANLRFMLLAGHETTASIMAWTLIELARDQTLWDRLRAEAESVGSVPQKPADLARFPFAEALFRETVRHHPGITLSKRRALVDFTLGGRLVSAGTNLCVPIAFWSRHPDLFERGDHFVVDRWLGPERPPKTVETLQFGGGPHFCVGYNLAWFEVVQFSVTLALVLGREGLRPRSAGTKQIRQTYFPISHPSTSARVSFSANLS